MPLRLPFATFLQNISPNQLHRVLRKHSVRAVPRTQIAIVVLSTACFANTKSLLEGTSSQTYESWICFSYNIEQFSHISPRAPLPYNVFTETCLQKTGEHDLCAQFSGQLCWTNNLYVFLQNLVQNLKNLPTNLSFTQKVFSNFPSQHSFAICCFTNVSDVLPLPYFSNVKSQNIRMIRQNLPTGNLEPFLRSLQQHRFGPPTTTP